MRRWEGPGLAAWRPWTPADAARVMSGVEVPWCVVGGWSIDLFAGRETRDHHDLEIAILRPDFPAVRQALSGRYRFHVVGQGEVRALRGGEDPPPDRHQNWVLDPEAEEWRMDVMLEPGDADVWVFRRDPTITAPRAQMVTHTADGIPYLRPQGSLLFKAKVASEKDDHDLATCLPLMETQAKAWLADALEHAHPGHRWLESLA